MATKYKFNGEIYENNDRVLNNISVGTVSSGSTASANITKSGGTASLNITFPMAPVVSATQPSYPCIWLDSSTD